jgi:hypothetical protein
MINFALLFLLHLLISTTIYLLRFLLYWTIEFPMVWVLLLHFSMLLCSLENWHRGPEVRLSSLSPLPPVLLHFFFMKSLLIPSVPSFAYIISTDVCSWIHKFVKGLQLAIYFFCHVLIKYEIKLYSFILIYFCYV